MTNKEYFKANKNKLPPFLMVRSGALRGWLPMLLALAAMLVCNKSKPQSADVLAIAISVAGLTWGTISTNFRKSEVYKDIKNIRTELENFVSQDEYKLDPEFGNKRLARILIRYMSKHNPEMFAKMAQHPKSVPSQFVMANIITGHLRNHPEDASAAKDAVHCAFIRNSYSEVMKSR